MLQLSRKPSSLYKTNMAAQLRFEKLGLGLKGCIWNNVLWTDKTKLEMSDHNTH